MEYSTPPFTDKAEATQPMCWIVAAQNPNRSSVFSNRKKAIKHPEQAAPGSHCLEQSTLVTVTRSMAALVSCQMHLSNYTDPKHTEGVEIPILKKRLALL